VEEFKIDFKHNVPKVFFLMIPLLALLLKISFLRNKHYYFVDHAVFALHVHSFVFVVILLWILNPFKQANHIVHVSIVYLIAIYIVLALRKVYHTKWLRSIFTLFFVALGYTLFLVCVYILAALVTWVA